MRKSWTRDEVIRQILEREANGLSLATGRGGIDKSVYGAARRIFGSWRNAIQAAGIEPQTILRVERWSPAKILVMIRHFARRNRPLTSKQMEQRYRNIVGAARRHFGSWSRAVIAAGVDPGKLRRVVLWTPERVIESILTRALRNQSLVARRVEPSSLAAAGQRFFGSWEGAIAAAGLDPTLTSPRASPKAPPNRRTIRTRAANPSKRRNLCWNKEMVIAAIRLRMAEHKPIHNRALARENQPLHNAVRRYFGGWKNAMHAAGLDPAAHQMAPSGRRTTPTGVDYVESVQKSPMIDLLRPTRP